MALLAHWVLMLALAAPEATEGATEEFVPPSVLEFVEAQRPTSDDRSEVAVVLAIVIDTDGRVSKLEVVETGGPAFDAAAIEAIGAFVFKPARDNGAAIVVEIEYRYVFDAQPEPQPEPIATEFEIDDEGIVVAPPIEVEAAEVQLDARQGELAAGTQGDAVKAAQTLAGVARPPVGSGQLVVWGAAPSDTRLYIDWMPVPSLFHVGGGRSVLPSPTVKSISLVPAGAGPDYGRALGGLVRVSTRDPRPFGASRSMGGFARVDPIDVSAGTDTRIGRRGWMMLALRQSILHRTYGAVAGSAARKLVPIPQYVDYQSKGHVQLSSSTTLELLAVGAHDELVRSIPSLTPDAAFTEEQTRGFHRVGLRLSRARSAKSSFSIATWAGLDERKTALRFGAVQAVGTERVWRGGLRIEERRRIAPFLVVRSGVDLEVGRYRSGRRGAITLPAREGDIGVFGQPPGDRVGEDAWTNVQAGVGVYTTLRFDLAEKRWRIEPGLRLEPVVISGDRIAPVRPVDPEVGYLKSELAVDPRLRIQWSPRPELKLFTAGGRYHQVARAADRSPVFGTPSLGLAEAYQAVAGVSGDATTWLTIAAQVFFVRSTHLAARADDPTPPQAELLVAQGKGRNYGGQLSVETRPIESVRATVAYSLMRAEREDPGAQSWRPFDFDQTHVVQALAGWAHRSGVELGGRFALSSGNPRTPVTGAVANSSTGSFDPVFGEHNSDRLPLFFELSLRVGWGRTWQWGTLRTWLDIQNATNRRNAQDFFYSSDFTRRGVVTGFPVLPLLGLEVRI